MIETGISRSLKRSSISTPPLSFAPTSKPRKSVSSSTASIGSFLSRAHQPSHSQPTTEGRIKLKHTIDCGSEVLCCKWSVDGSMLGAALRSGETRIFTPTGQPSVTIPAPETKITIDDPSDNFITSNKHHSSSQKCLQELIMEYLSNPVATSLVWHPDDSNVLIISYNDGQLMNWKLSGGVPPKGPRLSISDLGIDLKLAMAPGTHDDSILTYTPKKVVLRNINTFEPIVELSSPRPGGCQLSDAGSIWTVDGRGKDIVAGGHSLVWWNPRNGEVKRQISGAHIRGPALSIHPTANRMVTGSYGGGSDCVKLWEMSSGKATHTLGSENYQTNVKSAIWAGRDVLAVGGSDPNLIRLVTLDNTTLGGITGLKHGITWLDAYIARGHQSSKLAAASGPFIYIIELLK